MKFEEDLHPDDEKRREYLVKLLTISALTITPLDIVQAAWWGSTPKKLPSNKSFFSLEGDVRVDGRRADLSTRVNTGNVVRTYQNSEAVFVVGSDSFIMHSNSEMLIEGSNFLVSSLRLLSGSLLSVFGKRKLNQALTMNSLTATIGIRGTGVYMEAEPDLTYFCTCYGQVAMSSKADPNDFEIVTAKHHDAPKYISKSSSGGKYIQPAPFINHTDAELKLLEAIVGREVPFGIESELYKGERKEY